MTTEFILLKDLTAAIAVVCETAAAATEAFKVAYIASVPDKAVAKAAQLQAETRAAHARFEYQAVLSEAQAYVTGREAQ